MYLCMQLEGTKLIFIMNFSVLDFSKFAPRMPQIAQVKLISTFKIFRGEGECPGHPYKFPLFLSLAIPGSDKGKQKNSGVEQQISPCKWVMPICPWLICLACEKHHYLALLAKLSCTGFYEMDATSLWQCHGKWKILKFTWGAGIAQMVVLGLAVHSVACLILLWGHFR